MIRHKNIPYAINCMPHTIIFETSQNILTILFMHEAKTPNPRYGGHKMVATRDIKLQMALPHEEMLTVGFRAGSRTLLNRQLLSRNLPRRFDLTFRAGSWIRLRCTANCLGTCLGD